MKALVFILGMICIIYGTWGLTKSHYEDKAAESFSGDGEKNLKGYRLDLPEDISTVTVFPETPDTLVATIVGDVIHIRFVTDLPTIQVPPADQESDLNHSDYRYAYLLPQCHKPHK